LFWLTYPAGAASQELEWTVIVAIWAAIILTVYSGLEYVIKAISLLRR
jgi:hypothetical protein